MGSYLERLCVFICLGDMLANFLPSTKFAKLYRYVAGALILLLVLDPLGRGVSEFMEKGKDGGRELFQERLMEQGRLWDGKSADEAGKEAERMMDAYMESFTDEEIKEELERYGYEMEESQDGEVETAVR